MCWCRSRSLLSKFNAIHFRKSYFSSFSLGRITFSSVLCLLIDAAAAVLSSILTIFLKLMPPESCYRCSRNQCRWMASIVLFPAIVKRCCFQYVLFAMYFQRIFYMNFHFSISISLFILCLLSAYSMKNILLIFPPLPHRH